MGTPGDAFEQEADREQAAVASARPALASPDSRAGPRPNDAPGNPATHAGTPAGLGMGQPLGNDLRGVMEPRLGADLSEVRVHSDSTAAGHARALGARAFTAGNHIFFGENQFQPGTPGGLGLLAHELTHVVQQRAGLGLGGSNPVAPAIQRSPGDPAIAAATPAPRGPGAGAAKPPRVTVGAFAVTAPPHRPAAPAARAGPGAEARAPGRPAAAKAPADIGFAAAAGGEIDSGGPNPRAPDTGAGALETAQLVLIDVELAEHQRWSAALGRVGEVASLERAEFIAESVGGGFIEGAASGLAMGLGMGLVTRAVPALGPMIGGAMALHGLATRDWTETFDTIGQFGKGSDTYLVLANSIKSIAAVIDVVSQVLTVINGIVGVVEIAAAVIAGGATVLAVFTFGATLGIAAVAADVVLACHEISEGITVVTMILDTVNSAVLKPCETLFRSLHEFTTKADPREVEEQGHDISSAAAQSGAALGAWAGGRASQAGGRPRPPAEPGPPSQKPPHETPPPTPGDGPVVHFEPPPPLPLVEGATPPIPVVTEGARPIETPVVSRRVTDDQSAAPPPPPPAAPEAKPAAGEPAQLTIPGTQGKPPRGPRRPLTPDEIAPPDTHSAYLRHLRAVAAGEAPPAPGGTPYNIARHHVPGRDTAHPGTPTPDLYQLSPRPAGEQSHHIEQQSALRRSVRAYDPKEDPSVMMPTPEHYRTFKPQAEQRANKPALDRSLGTAGSAEENVNIAMWGRRTAPPPGSGATPMMPEAVAGQTEIEHLGYLFELHPISPRKGFGPDVETAYGYLQGRGMPVEEPDWDLTFNQPDPYRAAQPPGTQFGMLGAPDVPPPGARPWEQMNMPSMEQPGPNPNQASFPFEGAPGRRAGEGEFTRGQTPLTEEQYHEAVEMAVEMGMPREQIGQSSRYTQYGGTFDVLAIGPDVHPLPPAERPEGLVNPANAALEARAVIGHEVIGHREAQLGGQTRDEDWHEELQASARAALHTPGLSREQSWLLLQDAAARRRLQTEDQEIYIDTARYGPAAGPETPEGGVRGPGDEPSVVIDYEALGMTPEEAARYSPAYSVAAAQAARDAIAGEAPASPDAGQEPSTARKIGALFLPQIFGPGGEAPTYAERQAAHRALFTEDYQPEDHVERINPNYPPPPATPAEINAIQNEIINLLTVRATAEREAERQAARAGQCLENRGPIQHTVRDAQAGISAVRAHDQAIARREAVNQDQQRRHQESQGLVSGYPDRVAGITALTGPLAAWEGFTNLASHLPGEAGDKMLEMNREARQMQDAFDQMESGMLGVGSGGPARKEQLRSDQGRLQTTGQQAKVSDQGVHTADQGSQALQQSNQVAFYQASAARDHATNQAQQSSDAAEQRERKATSLAQQLEVWAQAHKAAREEAIAATEARLRSEGKLVLPRTQP